MERTTRSIHVRVLEEGIIETRPVDTFKEAETLENAVQNVKVLREIIGQRRCAILSHVNGNYITRDARDYYKYQEPLAVASALITKTLPQKMAVNLFLKFSKPKVPTKLFTSEEAALGWLREQLQRPQP